MASNKSMAVCDECGARVAPGAEVCDLCGNPLNGDKTPAERVYEEVAGAVGSEENETVQANRAEGVFCNQCGWKNPAGARFCSQCGAQLQNIAAIRPERPANLRGVPVASGLPSRRQPDAGGSSERAAENNSAVTRQVVILVTAGTLLVIALYLITVFSRNTAISEAAKAGPPSTPQDMPAAAPPPPQIAEQVASLEDQIASLTGEEKTAKQQELVNLYLQSGRLDLAAQEQERLAENVNTTEAWANAGHYYYGYMEQVEGQARVAAGQKAIAAYRRVLEQEPGNNDVRTDMATAFLYTNNPMEGVNQIKQVLDSDPNHVQANFNYGVMLSMIGRVDQALAQFEKVKTLVPEGSDNYRQANAAIETLRSSAGRTGSGRASAL